MSPIDAGQWKWTRWMSAVAVGIVASTVLSVVTARPASADPADTPGIDAGAMTWGDGGNGALGDGTIDSRLSPALYAGPNVHFTKISMSGRHALALAQDGRSGAGATTAAASWRAGSIDRPSTRRRSRSRT